MEIVTVDWKILKMKIDRVVWFGNHALCWIYISVIDVTDKMRSDNEATAINDL